MGSKLIAELAPAEHQSMPACTPCAEPLAHPPVPCISTPCSSAGATPAAPIPARITACWLGPCGAVRLLLRPSWFTAVPASSSATM